MTLDSAEILEHLVAFPTVSRDSNLPLIHWVRNFLADLGIDSHLVHDATGTKSNLFAIIGPPEAGGLALSGHTDVVPVDAEAWTSDPFKLTPRGSRLYGRGSCDMKGFIAAALACAPSWKQAQLSRPIHLMFSYDEEVGCLGVSSLISAARAQLPPPAAVIVGEPTSMRIATEHKGLCALRTVVSGIEAHSSLTHRGISAVMLAGELITQLGRISERLASSRRVGASRFEPPYTTLSVNRITGGTAINILAASCEFMWDIRAIPSESPRRVLEEIADYGRRRLEQLLAESKDCRIETTVLAKVPPLTAEHGGVAHDWARTSTDTPRDNICVPFGTEAGYFQEAGWSTVVCGPGSIEQAHKPDEFIERSQLADCEAFLQGMVHRQLL